MLYHFDGVCLCSGSEPPINNKPQRPQPTRQTSWKLVGNPGCQPGFPTSFQLVRLLGCGLKKSKILTDWGGWSSWPFEVDLLLLNAKVNTHYIVSSCWRLTRHLFSEKALTSVNHFFLIETWWTQGSNVYNRLWWQNTMKDSTTRNISLFARYIIS